jgi:hypothetical protein
MTKEQLLIHIWEHIDSLTPQLSLEEYADLLSELASEAKIREEAALDDIENLEP